MASMENMTRMMSQMQATMLGMEQCNKALEEEVQRQQGALAASEQKAEEARLRAERAENAATSSSQLPTAAVQALVNLPTAIASISHGGPRKKAGIDLMKLHSPPTWSAGDPQAFHRWALKLSDYLSSTQAQVLCSPIF